MFVDLGPVAVVSTALQDNVHAFLHKVTCGAPGVGRGRSGRPAATRLRATRLFDSPRRHTERRRNSSQHVSTESSWPFLAKSRPEASTSSALRVLLRVSTGTP